MLYITSNDTRKSLYRLIKSLKNKTNIVSNGIPKKYKEGNNSPYILTVEEADGTPSINGVNKIIVSNTTLTDNADGSVTITTGGGGGADVKVSIDAAATAGYLGAASNDGVFRTDASLTYTDGGDFITLSITNSTVKYHGQETVPVGGLIVDLGAIADDDFKHDVWVKIKSLDGIRHAQERPRTPELGGIDFMWYKDAGNLKVAISNDGGTDKTVVITYT